MGKEAKIKESYAIWSIREKWKERERERTKDYEKASDRKEEAE